LKTGGDRFFRNILSDYARQRPHLLHMKKPIKLRQAQVWKQGEISPKPLSRFEPPNRRKKTPKDLGKPKMGIYLCPSQIFGPVHGEEYLRIVHLERLEVEYKSTTTSAAKKGTHHKVSKKEFCRLLKNATLLASAETLAAPTP